MKRELVVWKDLLYRGDGINLSIYEIDIQHNKCFAAKLEWVEFRDGDMTPDEAVHRFTVQQGQELMNRLWDCGLRPVQGAGSAGQLAATEAHLNDMRALVFKTGKP